MVLQVVGTPVQPPAPVQHRSLTTSATAENWPESHVCAVAAGARAAARAAAKTAAQRIIARCRLLCASRLTPWWRKEREEMSNTVPAARLFRLPPPEA